MADVERFRNRDEAVTFARELDGLPVDIAVQRAEEHGYLVRVVGVGVVVTLEMNTNRVNLTPASDGTVLRATVG